MKNILITFISYDQDSFKVKKGDLAFMYSHRKALLQKDLISEDKLDQRKCPSEKLMEELPNIGECLTKDDIWRPTVGLSMGYAAIEGVQQDLHFNEIYILHDKGNIKANHDKLIAEILSDVENRKQPNCEIHPLPKVFDNAWDHNEVYKYLYHLLRQERFHEKGCQYYVNITSGTNAIKNCLFLLTQERVIDAKRIMPHPWNDPRTRNYRTTNGGYQIDDPAAFDTIYAEIRKEGLDKNISAINEHIETADPTFKKTLEQIAKVAAITRNPILLTGPTGSGKTQITKNIFTLLQKAGKRKGTFQHINCATLGGDPNISYSTLFGHVKGSYSGADKDEDGALKLADGGILFLDEIGTLGLKEQSMLLTAIEKKEFRPLGDTTDEKSDFMLICGTNENLWLAVKDGKFRRDLLERINLWHFELPSLSERKSEIMHQCKLFLDKTYREKNHGRKVDFVNQIAEDKFRNFIEEEYEWPGNFRELNAILERMCEMSVANGITLEIVEEEIERTRFLRKRAKESITKMDAQKNPTPPPEATSAEEKTMIQEPTKTKLQGIIGDEAYSTLAPLERIELDYIADICDHFSTLEELGKHLYGQTTNEDGKRSTLSRHLNKYGLSFRNGTLKRKSLQK